jgi:hypothetical protein
VKQERDTENETERNKTTMGEKKGREYIIFCMFNIVASG